MTDETKVTKGPEVIIRSSSLGAKLSDAGVRERTRARMHAIAQDPAKARAFLQEAGIVGPDGGLTSRFGG